MVRGNHEQVVRAHGVHHARKPFVERLERFPVASGVATMAIDGVEVHEVGEAQPSPVLAHDLVNMVHAVHVAFVVVGSVEPLAAEQIPCLANRDDVVTGILKHGKRRGARGHKPVIVTVRRALEIFLAGSHVWPSDYTPHGDLGSVDERAGILADAVQLIERDNVLMRCNLQHGIARGIDDEVARAQLLLAIIVDDLRA